MDYEIIDNFLSDHEFKFLQEHIVWNKNFPINFTSEVAKLKSDLDYNVTDEEIDREYWCWYGTHLFYNHIQLSPDYDLIDSMFIQKFKSLDKYHSLMRAKLNFYPYTESIREHPKHIDYHFSNWGAVFSLNTCDGFTRLSDGTKINSVENRIVFFDSSKEHNSSTTSNSKGRYNINFNFV